MKRQAYDDTVPTRTQDGTIHRTLMHPAVHGNQAQSLAEVIVPIGRRTMLHRHRQAEEVHHIVAGRGLITVGKDRIPVMRGDTVCVPPGVPHCIETSGLMALRILSCCWPASTREDTEIVEPVPMEGSASTQSGVATSQEDTVGGSDPGPLPPLLVSSGPQARSLRRSLQMKQGDFWGRAGIKQSAGCRYEQERDLPDPVRILLHLIYGAKKEARDLLTWLRENRPGTASQKEGFPLLEESEGPQARGLRRELGLSQRVFWECVMVTQSGGARYERGREMPRLIPLLLHLVFGTEQQALEKLEALRVNCA